MELTTAIIWIVVAIIVIALIASGKLRALCKAFFNLFVEDIASTPEGAEALFNQKEEEVSDKFRRADEVFKKVAGRRKRCKDELASLNAQLTKAEADCETLAKAQDREGLAIKVNVRADILEDIKMHNEELVTLEAALKDAGDARAACEENLAQIRKQRKQVVTQMKRNRDMKDIYADLEGIGASDHTSKLLDRVIEKGEDMADHVAGAKEAYETKSSTKSKQVDKKLAASANDAYMQELLNKYKK